MKEVLRTHLLSQAQSIKLALDLEGINAVLFNENALGYMNLAGEIRVMVVNPDDAARAREIIKSLEPPKPNKPTPPSRAWKWERRGLRLIGFAFLLFIAREMIPPRTVSRRLEAALLILTMALGAIGMVFVLAGLVFMEETTKPFANETPDSDRLAETARESPE